MRYTSPLEVLLLYVVMAAQASNSKPTSQDQTSHTSNQSMSPPDSQDSYMGYANQQPRSLAMQLHRLSSAGNNVTCNDGSQVGYYKRLNQHSKSWVIFLQGGGFCGSRESCLQRWQRTPFLMSSKYWPSSKTVDGILSNDPRENPYLWNANHIYVPYCSSDSWTGSAAASSQAQPTQAAGSDEPANLRANEPETESFAFLGSKIVERIFESLYDDLPMKQSLHDARFILLAGDSAGATGVILNLDKISALIERRTDSLRANCSQESQHCESRQTGPILRGLADSGWFLDNEPYNFELEFGEQTSGGGTNRPDNESQADCDQGRCTPLQSIKQAMQLWNGQVPESCLQSYANEPWRCYFGYRAYRTLRTPLFVVQWLYDEAQLMVDNIVRPGTSGQWNYVKKVVDEMRTSLENVTALFAPSCLSHSLIARKSWNQININGFKLPHILNSWEEQPLPAESVTGAGYTAIPTSSSLSSSSLDGRIASSGIVNQPTFETVLLEQDPPVLSSMTHDSALANMAASAFHLSGADKRSAPESRNQIIASRPASLGPAVAAGASNGQAKPRGRKRKRNNQQQQNKIKQSGRQRSNIQQQQQQQQQQHPATATTQNGPFDLTAPTSSSPSSREVNDLQQPTLNPIQDLLPLVDRSLSSAEFLYGRIGRPTDRTGGSSIRLGRSTIVDDATLILSNVVPDDSSRMTSSLISPSLVSVQDHQQAETRWSSEVRSRGTNYGTYASATRDSNYVPSRFRFMDSCGWPQCNRDCPNLTYELLSGDWQHVCLCIEDIVVQ